MILDFTAPWVTHTSKDGSGVADPSVPLPNLPIGVGKGPPFHSDAFLFSISGPAWCLWEAGTLIPTVLPKAGKYRVQLGFDLMVDQNFIRNGHVRETDIIVCTPDGYNINLSLQWEMVDGQVYVAGQGPGDWKPTGIFPTALTPDIWHLHLFQYTVDQDKHTGGVEAILIDGQLFMVPAALQGIIGINKKWASGLLFQTQPTLNEKGGSASYMLRNIRCQVVTL